MVQLQPKEGLSLDNVQEQGFLSFFQNIPEKPSTTIRIFDRGDYFTTHGEDALFTAKELFHTNSVVKYLGAGSSKMPSVVLSKLNFESFIRNLLLVKQYRVEVYKPRTSGKNDWEAIYKASPGNLVPFEDILFESHPELSVGAGVLSLRCINDGGNKVIGAALVDVSEQTLLLNEFVDNDSFTNLEALIIQLGAKECIIPTGDSSPEGSKLKQILTRNKLLVTERKRSEFSEKGACQDLCRLIRATEENFGTLAARPEMQLFNALPALVAAIKYLDLLADESNLHQFTLKTYELKGILQLDAAALSALHIEPTSESQLDLGKEHTLFSLLDKCGTPQGRRLLTQWLRQPLMDINKIVERQDLVEVIVHNVEMRHSLKDIHLKQIPDLSRLSRKLGQKRVTLQDCYKLYICLTQLPDLCETLAKYDGPHKATLDAMFIVPLQEILNDMIKFQEMVETTMDLNQASVGEYVIKPEFDDCLAELREQMDSLETSIQKQLKKIASDSGLDAGKSLKLENNSQLGYFFRVTLKDEKVLRNNRNYKIIDTNKAGVRFRNIVVQDLNDQYLTAKADYAKQQKNVADEIISIAAGYIDVTLQLCSVMAILDCIVAMATVAASAPMPYCRPKLLPKGTGIIELKHCRHPCVEQMDEISYIPNNCLMTKDSGIFHIITGPNMGGKSTFLRSVGMTVLMAHIGSFVPCEEATISIVNSILVRVGSGDCQLKGVSTFMTEMLETASIIQKATKDSLIIIDELGRGTSTYDGFGLAWAISEAIAKRIGAFCLFATHFHELTALSDEVPTVKNYHVTATTASGTLTLLYQVKAGSCDRSFGIHVAELAHFPSNVIEFAKRKARELEETIDDDDDNSEEAIARRKKWKKEEKDIIEKYLEKAAQLDIDKISDEQLDMEIQKMRNELKEIENPYIQKLLLS